MEMVLNTQTLPEPLHRLIFTERVKVREMQGKITLTPVRETNSDCPLLGMFANSKTSSYAFMAAKQNEKALES